MKFRLRRKRHRSEEKHQLALPDVNGEPAIEFPMELVDSMRGLISRLSREGGFPASLAIVGSLRQEGVTKISRALAATMAHDLAARVCLVELNWWWPSTPFLSTTRNDGMAGLVRDSSLDEVLSPTGWSNLVYLQSGVVSRAERPVVARSERLRTAISDLGKQFDHLVLDVPAVLATNDAVVLAGLAQSSCLVIRQGATHAGDVQRTLDEIEHLNIAGVVLNRIVVKTPRMLTDLFPGSVG